MSTQIKEIKLSGLSTSPDDLQADDGNLAIAANVLHDDGRIIHATSPDAIYNAGTGSIIYQHANDSYKHLIRRNGTSYYWHSYQTNGTVSDGVKFSELDGKDVKHIISVGNTIIAYTDSEKYYFIFRSQKYEYIGTNAPEIKIKPLIRNVLSLYVDDNNSSYFDSGIKRTDIYQIKNDSEKRAIMTNAVLGKVNEMMEKCNTDNKFVMPFLVRIAYRMFDGSLTSHTSPILMVTTEGGLPHIDPMEASSGNVFFSVIYNRCTLHYLIDNLEQFKASLQNWRDIITGVTFCVSAPIYTYDQDGKELDLSFYGPSIGPISNDHQISSIQFTQEIEWTEKEETQEGEEIDVTKYRDFGTFFMTPAKRKVQYTQPSSSMTDLRIRLPQLSQSIDSRIAETGNFYVISEVKINDLQADADVPIDGTLQSVYSKESISDDFESHDNIIPNVVSTYNGRLIMADVTKQYYDNGYLWSFEHVQLTDADPVIDISTAPEAGNDNFKASNHFTENRESAEPIDFAMAVYIKDSMSSAGSIARLNIPDEIPEDIAIPYFYYPNPCASRLYIMKDGTYYVYNLEEHKSLNGSVFSDIACKSSAVRTFTQTSTDITAEESNVIKVIKGETTCNTQRFQSLTYTSEAGNPFKFTAANVEQVGNGSIIALAPAAQALSNGQFGEFPMYCFTTEGIWALSPSDTGGWKSKQPISRDVALSADAILQTDQSVIFATDRGLLQITGSTVTYISDIFDGFPDVFTKRYQSHLNELFSEQPSIIAGLPPFKKFLQGCNMHYAYSPQRIYIGNANYPHAYVFCMKDRLWSSVPLRITSAVNSYPEALAMTQQSSGNILVDLSAPGTASTIPGCMLTRPIHLDDPHGLKTIRTIVARGRFSHQHVHMMLYASRNLTDWIIIGKAAGPRISLMHGTPFRAFRLAIVTTLSQYEYLDSLSIEYETKLTNKLR